MKRILLPVDLSQQSQPPADYAIALAKAFDAKVYLFHSYYERLYIAAGTFPESLATQLVVDVQMISEIGEEAQKKLDLMAEDIANRFGRPQEGNVFVKMEAGEPYAAILSYASEINSDLIIAGAKGHGLKNHFSGSIAQKLLNGSPIPVMAVPDGYAYNGFKSVFYPADLSNTIVEDLQNLIDFFRPYHSLIHCVHMQSGTDDFEIATLADLKERFELEEKEGLIKFHVCACDTAVEKFNEFIIDYSVSLIAFHQHRSTFFSWLNNELTKRDFYKANIPLLSLP